MAESLSQTLRIIIDPGQPFLYSMIAYARKFVLLSSNSIYWDEGQLVRADQSLTDTMTYSMHYGFSVFEGLRCYQGHSGANFFRLHCHNRRLKDSAKLLNIPLSHSDEVLTDAQRQVMKANGLVNGYLRPIVFLGGGGLGLDVANQSSRTVICAWDWQRNALSEDKPMRVKISSYTRSSTGTTLYKAKASGNYLVPSLALTEAKSLGFDEAILLDERGFVTEGSAQNVFIVRNGKLYTPTLACALDGITRNSVITLAKANRIEVSEQNISREELLTADEVFFSSTACEIMPIHQVDQHLVGNGKTGELTSVLKQAFTNVVQGKDPEFAHWLTPLNL